MTLTCLNGYQREPAAGASDLIRAQLYDPASAQTRFGGDELLEEWAGSSDAVIWVDLFDLPPDDEKALLERLFGLHPAVIEDAQLKRHPPKLEEFESYTFLLMKGLTAETQDIYFATLQIAAFVGTRFLVTRHSDVSPSTDKLWKLTEETPSLIREGPSALALRLVNILMDRYLPILLAVEARLEYLEREVAINPRDELLTELIGLKANLTRMRRIATYHAQVFQQASASTPVAFRPGQRHELRDIYEKLERASSLTSLYYDLSADLMEGYISLASHRLNNIMKVLTIVASIFIPLTFFAGIYGMNFEHMPELGFEYSYYILLAIMAIVAVVLLVVFRKKKWL